MIKKKRFIVIIICVLCILVLFGIFKLSGFRNISMYAEYPYYSDEQSLFDHADLIICGVVTKINRPTKINIWNAGTSQGTDEDDRILYTASVLRVVDVIKGSVKIGDSLNIKQLGDKIWSAEATLIEVDGYLKKDSQYILLLKDSNNSNNSYSTLSPMQGQIPIVDGKTNVNNIYAFFKTGIPLEEFIAELKTKVNSYQ